MKCVIYLVKRLQKMSEKKAGLKKIIIFCSVNNRCLTKRKISKIIRKFVIASM